MSIESRPVSGNELARRLDTILGEIDGITANSNPEDVPMEYIAECLLPRMKAFTDDLQQFAINNLHEKKPKPKRGLLRKLGLRK